MHTRSMPGRNTGLIRPAIRPAILTAALVGTSALAASVAADVAGDSYYITSSAFKYRIWHMPDLDQRRDVIPNNGAMYCAPTAAVNLFAYAANHGFPGVLPAGLNWQSNGNYGTASFAILAMASNMDTDPVDGTGGSGSSAGYNEWISGTLLAYNGYSKSSSYTPTVAKMVKLAMQGWIVSFAYGRYEVIGNVGGVPRVDRTGGHVVTLARAFTDGSTRTLRYKDPASDSANLQAQSAFANKLVSYTPITLAFSSNPLSIRTMNAIAYPSSDGLIRLVDSYRAIRPKFGIAFANTGDALTGGSLKLIDPTPFPGSINLQMPSIPISNFATLLDLAMTPDQTEAYIILDSVFTAPTSLRRLDLFEGTSVELPNDPGDMLRIAVSRKGPIYAMDAASLYRLDGETGGILNSISSNPTPTAIAADDTTDSCWLLSVPQRRLLRYTESLDGAANNWVIPTPVPMSGDGSVAVDRTGKPYFCTAASNSIYGISQGAAGGIQVETISFPEIQNPRSIRFGPTGEMMVIGDGSVKVLRRVVTGVAGGGGADGSWQLDPTDPFHGQVASPPFAVVGSRTNHDPAEHDTPGWMDIPADQLLPIGTETVECVADLNDDGVVNGADITIVLGAWGTSSGIPDLNSDGIVNGGDITILLGNWGPCPG